MTDPLVEVQCTLNGRSYRAQVRPTETLLHTIRETWHLTGTKEGCVEGECGACTVLLDGEPVDSCILASVTVDGHDIRTVEGLAAAGELAPLQSAFVEHGAVQCGFCTPGFLMTLTALVEQNPTPSADDVRFALAGNICRCTGYEQVVDAVLAAAEELR